MTVERSALDKRLFDHEVSGFVVAAFGEATRLEQLPEFPKHRRAAAHHDAIGCDIERRLADIVE